MHLPTSTQRIDGNSAYSTKNVSSKKRIAPEMLLFIIPGLLLIADLAFMGSGEWSELFGFSARKLLFLVIVCYSFVAWVSAARILYAPGAVVALAIFIIIWGVLIPVARNTPIGHAISDSQLFVGLLFAPAIAMAVARTHCWPGSLRLIERLLWLLAILHISIFWYQRFSGDGATALVSAMRAVLEPDRAIEETSIFIGPISDGFRVFWGASVFLLLALYFAVRNFGRRKFIVSMLIFLMVSHAIQVTLTRGIVLSIPFFLLLFWLFNQLLKSVRMGVALYALTGAMLLLVTLPIILLASPGVLETIRLGREISDDIRYEQVSALGSAIFDRPWFGSGLGAGVELVRSEATPWSYELSILGLYMKVGMVGAAVLVTVFVWFTQLGLAHLPQHESLSKPVRRKLAGIAALLYSIVFCSNTNPYLFSMLGWGLLMFVYLEFSDMCSLDGPRKTVG